MRIQILKKLIICAVVAGSSWTKAMAEDSLIGYDSIVDTLSVKRTSGSSGSYSDPFADVMLHAGIGMTMSMTSLQLGDRELRGYFQGMELNFGIDLFSPFWVAEFAYRNLGEAELDTVEVNDIVRLNEFDMRVSNKNYVSRNMNVHWGLGMAARYATVTDYNSGQEADYVTPAWMFHAGSSVKLTRLLTVGAELAYRNSMIQETIDKSALGASLRLDANF